MKHYKSLLFIFFLLTFLELKAQVGGNIYEAIPLPKSTPIPLPKFNLPPVNNPSVSDNYYLNERRRLELNILREKYKQLKRQNQSTEKDEVIFDLKYYNIPNEKMELTEWNPVKNPSYMIVTKKVLTMTNGDESCNFDIERIDSSNPNFTNFIIDKNLAIGILPMESKLYMIIINDSEEPMSFIGGIIKL